MSNVSISNLPAASGLNTTDLLPIVQTDITSRTTAGAITATMTGFTQAGTSPTARTVQAKQREIITPEDFGAVGDGTTDDILPLTRFFNELMQNASHVCGYAPAKTYAISSSLPTITASSFMLLGSGIFGLHDVGSAGGTIIKAIAGCTGTMLTIAPTEGATGQYLYGIYIKGITFDCNDIAAKGIITKSMKYCDYDWCVLNASTTGWEMNVSATLGESTDAQFNRIRYAGRQSSTVGTNGVSLRLMGDANGNPSMNFFECVDIIQKDALGIIEENADNNYWAVVRVFRAAGGTATNSIEWRGGATSALSCRYESFGMLSTTRAAIAKGTGTYTVGASTISIDHLDKGNGTPTPTEETGTTIYDNEFRTYTPTLSAGTGAFTSATATGRYRRSRNLMFVEVNVTITTNGTAASFIRTTLPTASGASAKAQTIAGIETFISGLMLRGLINQNSSDMDTITAAGAYPGADGAIVQMSGSYESA